MTGSTEQACGVRQDGIMALRHRALVALAAAGTAALLLLAGAGDAAAAKTGRARQSMEQCVERLLQSFARERAPAERVGPAVVSRCEGPLRETLAEAIRSGEAGLCTLESCLSLARERAAEEATMAYRQMTTR